jgi:hypothetical protein
MFYLDSLFFQVNDKVESINPIIFFFFDSRKPYPPESVFCGPRWWSKTPAVPGSYKRYTPWLELETCCADLKPFTIMLRLLRTLKLRLSQALTRGARPDSNSRPAVQISNPLPLRYAPWGMFINKSKNLVKRLHLSYLTTMPSFGIAAQTKMG